MSALTSSAEFARARSLSEQRVRQLLAAGKIPDAIRIGARWAIPGGAAPPRPPPRPRARSPPAVQTRKRSQAGGARMRGRARKSRRARARGRLARLRRSPAGIRSRPADRLLPGEEVERGRLGRDRGRAALRRSGGRDL